MKDLNYDQARNMIERAHRGRSNRYNEGPRPIYAAIFHWKDAEWVKEEFLEKNKRSRAFPYIVEQMYGPLTSRRRNQALKTRMELKNEGTIVSGFIQYPAKLFVKYNNRDKKYTMHKNFSNEKVIFETTTPERFEDND